MSSEYTSSKILTLQKKSHEEKIQSHISDLSQEYFAVAPIFLMMKNQIYQHGGIYQNDFLY